MTEPTPQPSYPLHEAVLDVRLHVLAQLLEQGDLDIHARDLVGMTALDWAVDRGRLEWAAVLLQHGADPNLAPDPGTAERPLIAAILQKDTAMAALLLQHGAEVDRCDNYDYPPIQRAAYNLDLPMVQLLLKHNAELHFPIGNREDLIAGALQFSSPDITELLLRSGALRNPSPSQLSEYLFVAIQKGAFGCVRWLVDHGASVHGFPLHATTTPLMESNNHGRLDVALYLVERGADPHFLPDAARHYDWEASAGSEDTRRWRESLRIHATLTQATGEGVSTAPRLRF